MESNKDNTKITISSGGHSVETTPEQLREYASKLRKSRIKPISDKTRKRNAIWRQRCLERAEQLRLKYGHIICEYSGETITTLSTMGDALNDGWGHHIDGNRSNNTIENCYIVKYKHHSYIHDHNIVVSSEVFGTRRLWL